MTDHEQRRQAFLASLRDIYDEQRSAAIEASMLAPKRQAFWRNPLRPVADAAFTLILQALDAHPVPGLTDLWSVTHDRRSTLVRHELSNSGALYPINPSSVWAARQLRVQPGHEVLDLAAAPGGKSLQLAAAMANTGRLALVESVPARFHRMRANLARVGVTNAHTYLDDGRATGRKVGERFDRVLLDAPCSSETRIRLDEPETFAHWSPRKVGEAARKQKRLLRSAFACLKPGGRLLYSTCAFAQAENERVVHALLKREPRARCLPVPPPPAPWLPGIDLPEAQRILPDELWNGFFLCLIEKSAD